MNELNLHYQLLLGLDSNWEVQSVDLNLPENRVDIALTYGGSRLRCPECGDECGRFDTAPERTWRHLDTMNFETLIHARVPRCNCNRCGVKTIEVTWAGKHSRFTLMFEAFAIQVFQACPTIKRAAALLRLDWDAAHAIMQRAVVRGLQRRAVEEVKYVGIDEESFLRGQSYASVLTDLDNHRVLEVTEGRDEAASKKLLETLPEPQQDKVEAVCMDMWKPYANAVEKVLPNAAIVHDKFHIAKHLNEAIDQVRRAENKLLLKLSDERLKGTRQLWLFREANLSDEHSKIMDSLKAENLKTARAWAIKERFNYLWWMTSEGWAKREFDQWYNWAIRSQLTPIKKVAKMLKRHLPNILTHFKHRITNAAAEGFNSAIQLIKSNARGFRNFENYRIRILFYCGKLNLMPDGTTH